MANTLTVTTGYTEGVSVQCDGFTPVIKKHFDTSVVGMAANAEIVALKVPEGSILRHVIIDVKTAGTADVHVGNHIGNLTSSAITTDPDAYTGSETGDEIDLAILGKTLIASPTAAIVAADHYIVVKPLAAESAAVFDIIAVVDVFDVAAYRN